MKRQLFIPIVILALACAASRPTFAGRPPPDDDDDAKPTTAASPALPGAPSSPEPTKQDQELEVKLKPEALAHVHIRIGSVSRTRISTTVSMTGTVAADETRVVHLSSKVEGLVRSEPKTLGDTVKAGEPVLVLDSAQLGNVKVELLKQYQDLELARADLARKATVQENVQRLIALLRHETSPTQISAKTANQAMGEARARLLTPYSSMRLARKALARETTLFRERVTSEKEYQEALKDLETAQAQFQSAVDEVSYAADLERITAGKTLKNHEASYDAALRQLQMLGLTDAEIEELRAGRATNLTLFTLRAPTDGTVTDEQLTRGQKVLAETSLLTLVDLTRVWVMADVYEKDIARVRQGLPVVVEVTAYPGQKLSGTINAIAPAVDPSTRTVRLRIVVDNPQGLLKVGMFARVDAVSGSEATALTIPAEALQDLDGKPVVFVPENDRTFHVQPVTIGARDPVGKTVEVVSGLRDAQAIVTEGSFQLKSELRKGSLAEDKD